MTLNIILQKHTICNINHLRRIWDDVGTAIAYNSRTQADRVT